MTPRTTRRIRRTLAIVLGVVLALAFAMCDGEPPPAVDVETHPEEAGEVR